MEEYSLIEEKRTIIIEEAESHAKMIVDRGRKGAVEAAKVIENKAKEDAQIVLGNAMHEITAQKEKALDELKKESVELAVSLASRLIEEELDEKRHNKFIDRMIEEFKPEDYDH
jgi:F-type H+-transporting ATPase subunit b